MINAGVVAGSRRRTVAATPGSAPTLTAPLHAYYDATVQTAANNTSLTSLVDQSGNARNATKTAGTITYKTAGVNGLPSFDFASGAYATTATFTAVPSTSAITIFAVAQFTTLGSQRDLVAAASPSFSMECGATATAWLANRAANVTGGTSDTSPHRFRFFLAASGGATSAVDVGGTTVAGPAAAGSGAPTSWRLGASSSGFAGFIGQISELRIYTGTATSTEITAMNTYLASKWGV